MLPAASFNPQFKTDAPQTPPSNPRPDRDYSPVTCFRQRLQEGAESSLQTPPFQEGDPKFRPPAEKGHGARVINWVFTWMEHSRLILLPQLKQLGSAQGCCDPRFCTRLSCFQFLTLIFFPGLKQPFSPSVALPPRSLPGPTSTAQVGIAPPCCEQKSTAANGSSSS